MQITRSTDFGQKGIGPGAGAGYTYEPVTQLVSASNDPNPVNYNAQNNDFLILVDASSQNVQITLPAASVSKGQHKMIKRSDTAFAAANSVSLVTVDGSQIEGSASQSLTAQNSIVEVKSDGAQWQVIGGTNSAAWGAAGAIAALTVGASPFAYTAQAAGTVVISGGTVSAVTLKRGSPAAISVGETAGVVPVSAGDIVTVTYTVAPTMDFVPR
ncbi:hypothetical protein WS62_23475 [Burkholderia sp. ABCPW 14]|uniref:hypothetical protein n=1 Tax=Burkholderia sp. ABCPW 14 TaxID=1637860 RepID=UPI000770E38C|nr:hypothetical protein [Burkholderia sp. ABCPW 14]KVD81920.1 hypothetical protein WS62_23475 [Burkholderia sp. ABCPW 14]